MITFFIIGIAVLTLVVVASVFTIVKNRGVKSSDVAPSKKASGGGSMIFWPLSRLGVACLTAGLAIFCWWAWYEMKDSGHMHKGMMIADGTGLKVSKLPKGGDKSKLDRYQYPQKADMGRLEGFLVPPGVELVVVPLKMTPDGSYQPSDFTPSFTYTNQKLSSDYWKTVLEVYTLYLEAIPKIKKRP
ncbi:MAG: hypothetical protein R3B39_02220 [Candidatus Paceibacterota bacterium]